MNKVITPEGRRQYLDKEGGHYRISWFIYDHYGFTTNPRFHDDGVHHIFDHYQDLFLRDNPQGDGVYWHYHHVPSSGDALEWCTNWNLNGIHEEILARRIIDRRWFPSVFRAGGHIERNDLSHWLEMIIPFDFSGRTPHGMVYERQRASVHDWRHAPKEWGCWHPDWYDYRRCGSMKRRIFRCLDLKTWMFSITERDVFEAFELAHFTGRSVLGYYNHDYRDLKTEVDHVYPLIKKVSAQFPDVTWRFANALDAAKGYVGADDRAPTFDWDVRNGMLTIRSDVDLFGPAPFLAIREGGRYFRDHPTCEDHRTWCYHFRRPAEVEAFGIAGSSPMGNCGLSVYQGSVTSAIDSAGAGKRRPIRSVG
jgi:hypothetical protein